jgi:catechol 2,3-dioxygenase-like lactoylglutathione lyase family enzyme
VSVLAISSGCMSLSPQLPATDYDALDRLESREEREKAYVENAVYPKRDTRGIRYVKGTAPNAISRSWQSLDVVLRSDRNAAAALPYKKLRASRILTAFAVTTGIVAVAAFAASAREGFELARLSASGGLLIGAGIATVAFAIGAGVTYGQSRKGYEAAVDLYNDSLGMRLGLYTPKGEYIPPKGVLVDEDGFIILDQKEIRYLDAPKPKEEGPTEPLPGIDESAAEGDAGEGEGETGSGTAGTEVKDGDAEDAKAKPPGSAVSLLPRSP